jgi:hypothetical protein
MQLYAEKTLGLPGSGAICSAPVPGGAEIASITDDIENKLDLVSSFHQLLSMTMRQLESS